MEIESSVKFVFKDTKHAEIFYKILNDDLKRIPMKRSRVSLDKFDGENLTVTFSIYAEDIVAFKASITNLIQTAQLIEGTVDFMVENEKT